MSLASDELEAPSVDGKYTRALAQYVASADYDTLPEEVVERVKYFMLDGFGCGIYGSSLPWSRLLADTLEDFGGGGVAAAWGTDRLVPADQAALLNGAYVQAFELDDYSRTGGFHASSLVLPAVLAASSMRPGVTGEELIAATVVGFEVGNRVGRCIGATKVISRGWHTGSILGPLAAAAGASRILGLNARQIEHAFGIAATLAGGLMGVQFGAMVKRMHHGRASQSGLYGASLASRGYTGIEAVFELPYGGFCSTFTGSEDDFDLEALIDGLGEDYRVFETCVKPYACRGPINVALTALRAILDSQGLKTVEVDDVVEVRVSTTKATVLKSGWDYAATGSATEAQMNLGFGLAVMLLEGDAFVNQYREEMFTDPRVLALVRKIKIVNDEALDQLGEKHRHHVRVELELRDGTIAAEERYVSLGSGQDPLSNEAVAEKFDKLVSARQGQGGAQQVKELVLGAEKLPDIAPLQQALAKA